MGGTAILYSINYDYTFLHNNKPKFNLGLGASLFPLLGWSSGVTYIPLLTAQANLLTGKEKHFLETGVSFLYIVPAARIGYRYQASEGGFLFRAAFTPFYVPSGVGIGFSGFQPWGGVSLGYTF